VKRRTTPAWPSGAPGEAHSTSRLCVVTASIAHEVSQPLSGIVTNASTCLRLLSADVPDLEGVRETTRRTLRDANRVAAIVDRLRALFEGTRVAMEPVDVNEAVREALTPAVGEIAAHRVAVSCRFATGCRP
jgi:C4-dicarboxylate-specific signal transduction histidine kinase